MKQEIDYELLAKCVKKSGYDFSKRKVVTKKIKGVPRKVIVDYNSEETIKKFNECVENADNTTLNASSQEINELKNKETVDLTEIVPQTLTNIPANATISVIGGYIVGRIFKFGFIGTVLSGLTIFTALSFNYFRKINKSYDKYLKK